MLYYLYIRYLIYVIYNYIYIECIHTYIHIYIHIYVCIYVYIWLYICIYIYKYIIFAKLAWSVFWIRKPNLNFCFEALILFTELHSLYSLGRLL